MEFSRQEYWSGLLFPPPEELPNPIIEAVSLLSPALLVYSLQLSHQGRPSYLILRILEQADESK